MSSAQTDSPDQPSWMKLTAGRLLSFSQRVGIRFLDHVKFLDHEQLVQHQLVS